MNIIIPMAGIGSRLRPHTLTVPKPLVPVAGKPIVQRFLGTIRFGRNLGGRNSGTMTTQQAQGGAQNLSAALGLSFEPGF